MRFFIVFIFIILSSFLSFAQLKEVNATYETDDVPNYNAADDPAIYVHPTNSDSSFFIGTDKSTIGGLELYNMDGTRYWTTPVNKSLNNVDVLYGFPLGTDTVDLVGASNRTSNRLEMYLVDNDSRTLINITGQTNTGLSGLYGFTFYKDVCNNKYYAFITLKNSSGFVYQYELTDNGAGAIDAVLVRQILNLPSRTEGMVVDQILGHLYVSEESVGVWKYSAAPSGGSARILMDSISGSGHLNSGVEGISMYYATDTTGYLLVCSQSTSSVQVYERAGANTFIGEFSITAGIIPACYQPDGIDVQSFPVSSTYPNGAFISHDNAPSGQYTNYIMVPWESIADSVGLTITLTKDPRKIGENYCGSVPTTSSVVSINSTIENSIFPNPANSEIIISWKGASFTKEMQVINTLGEIVLKKTVANNERVELTNLPQGVYFVQIESDILRLIVSK